MVEQCDNCKFYRLRQPAVLAPMTAGTPATKPIPECRFSDPFMGGWPIVKADDWCGKYVVIGAATGREYMLGEVPP